MKIAFVFAPYRHKKFEENLYVVDEDFGLFPPINLAYAAAIAEQNGHTVKLFDINALLRSKTSDAREIIRDIERFDPDLLAFYFSTYMFHDTLSWVRTIRSRIDRPVVAGGINCLLYPRETLTHDEIDYCVIGHAHQSLPLLLDAVGDFNRLGKIEGIGYKENGVVRVTQKREEQLVDFNSFPFPARHLLNNELYYSFISQRKNFTIAVTSIGCPYKCNFCAIADLPRGYRSPDNIVTEIDEVYSRFGVREIDFFDANFVVSRSRTEELLEKIIALDYNIEFSCRSRVDCLDEKMLRLLKRAGCRQIYLGIESSEQRILDLLSKTIKPSISREVVQNMKKVGIRPLGFFMVGSPGETLQTILKTILFSITLGLDYAQFSRTIAKPHSKLHRDLIESSGSDYWREYILGNEAERRISNTWTELSENQIDFMTKLAYYVFYYRPTHIIRSVSKVRSWEELSRSVRTAVRMLLKWRYFD